MIAFGCALADPGFSAEAVSFQVHGGDSALEKQLMEASLVNSAHRDGVENPRDIMAAALADYARLLETLYANGHYSGIVNILLDGREAALIPVFATPARIRDVLIRIDPGKPFHFGTARVAPLLKESDLPEGFRTGKLARSVLIQNAAKTAAEGWRDAGYAKVALTDQNVTADHVRHKLSADLRLAPGPRVRFGKLLISGNSAVRTARINAISGLPSGRIFSPAALALTAKRLRRTGAWSSVSLSEAETLGPGNTMDIDLALVDAKPRRLGFGAEISSFEGLSLSGYWLHRNLLGGAERLRFDAEVAGLTADGKGIDYSLGARLDRPATFGPDTSSYAMLGLARLDEPGYKSKQVDVGIGFSRIFSETLTAELGVAFRYSDIEDSMGHRNFTQLTFPATVTWDRRDNFLEATKGFYLKGEATPFLGLNGGGSGARFFADGRAYRGLGGQDRFVVAGRVQLGSIISASATAVPPDYLFYSGGGNTVRGHPYQSLAIDLDGGGTIGGRSFAGVSVELRTKITPKIGVTGFADAGYVAAGGLGDRNGAWHTGVGLGLRYQTGLGPIRLDLAVPTSGDTGRGMQIYIGIGHAF